MPTGIIEAVTGKREWSGNYGPMVDYSLTIDGNEVYLTKKPDSPAPEPGESLDYEVVKRDQHGTKIKKVWNEGGAQATTNGSSAPAPSQAARQESIERQVAAKCAAEVVAALAANGKLATSGAVEQTFDKLTNSFHTTIRGYTVEKVDPANSIAQDSLPAPDTSGTKKPDPGTTGGGVPDDDIPFAPSVV